MVDGKVIDDPAEKAYAFRSTFFERFIDEDDLEYNSFVIYIVFKSYFSWQIYFSEKELKAITISMKSISLSIDRISVRFLKAY